MTIYDKRQTDKERRKQYREKAAQRVANLGGIRVAPTAYVAPTLDGAFVEATIWVSDEELGVKDAK
jgi:hypothetical protein